MMETQKILKPLDKVVIIADYREKEVIQHLRSMNVLINEMSLDVGDFICSGGVAVERKEHSDFVSSIIDGRLFEQAKELKENFERPIIIVEGYSNREINDNALKAALASLIVEFGVSLVNTKNPYDTARLIYWIAKKEQKENKKGVSFKVGKKPKELKVLQERVVASLPGVDRVISRRLLNYFGSVESVFRASEEELKKVRGIGQKLAAKIRKVLEEKYIR